MNGYQIHSKTLLCKLSNVTPSTPSSTSSTPTTPLSNISPQNQPSLNLYVKNLPVHYREEQLRALFNPFGEILDVKVMIDKNTGESRQIGFVRYSNQQQATNALNEMHGHMLEHSEIPLAVRYAETENEKLMRKQRQQTQTRTPNRPAQHKQIYHYMDQQNQPYFSQTSQLLQSGKFYFLYLTMMK
jgi:RNA recognition motif-containing protein